MLDFIMIEHFEQLYGILIYHFTTWLKQSSRERSKILSQLVKEYFFEIAFNIPPLL